MQGDESQHVNPCPLKCFPLRLLPGQEIKTELLSFVEKTKLKAAFVLTCVGSVTSARFRMADSTTIKDFEGHYEIVSLVGTLSAGAHLHISLSDVKGDVIGGHVIGPLIVFTTAEIVIGECEGATMVREPDSKTGYNELVVIQGKT